jgi:hypothetical protein
LLYTECTNRQIALLVVTVRAIVCAAVIPSGAAMPPVGDAPCRFGRTGAGRHTTITNEVTVRDADIYDR